MFFRRLIPEPLGQVNPLVRALALLFLVALFVFIASTNRPKQTAADPAKGIAEPQAAQTAILVMPNNSADSGNISIGTQQGARYQVSMNAGEHGTTYNLYAADGKAILLGVSLADIRRQYPEVDVSSLEAAERAATPR